MSKRIPQGTQTDTIIRSSPFVQESFDLKRLDAFVTSLGVDWLHYRATPSPIGKVDRGDMRRSDEGVDTITSNGMIYRLAGEFTATITDNGRNQKEAYSVAGQLDPSEARLVLPRFYNKKSIPGVTLPNQGVAEGERIYLTPGDRLYLADSDANVLVAYYQLMDYEQDIDNEPIFPIVALQDKIIDSQNIEYIQNVDYIITKQGGIRWLSEGKNPGIDPNTNKGRIYSIRYLYKAFYYVVSLPNEIRITNVTTNGLRSPKRMPMQASIVREYVYHNQNRGNKTNENVTKTPSRRDFMPQQSIKPNEFQISVDMSTVEDEEN